MTEHGELPGGAWPLGTWSRTWRVLVAVGVGALLWLFVMPDSWGRATPDDRAAVQAAALLDIALAVVALALLPGRRRWPLAVACLTAALTAVSVAAIGPAAICAVSISTRRRWRELVVVFVVWTLAGGFYELIYRRGGAGAADTGFALFSVGGSVLVGALLIATGCYIGTRRDLVRSLAARAAAAERAQRLQESQGRQRERARIAREMHDVLAHRISLVALHAGAIAYHPTAPPEDLARAAELVRDNAHQALEDLREVLGVLRADEGAGSDRPGGDGPTEPPQPTLAALPSLLADAVAVGGAVRLDVSGLPGGSLDGAASLPTTHSRTSFRVVQEALTNARKHAPGGRADVVLSGGPETGLLTQVLTPRSSARPAPPDRPAVPGAGLGLLGAAERAALCGGSLEHGPTPEGGFLVRLWVPWPT